MQAYKLNATIDESGHLIIDEPLNIAPGKVEIIILQPTATTTDNPKQTKKREYKVQALKDLLENAPPTPPDFDPDEAQKPIQSQQETSNRPNKIEALQSWFKKTQPAPADFDADEARWEALKEKHNL